MSHSGGIGKLRNDDVVYSDGKVKLRWRGFPLTPCENDNCYCYGYCQLPLPTADCHWWKRQLCIRLQYI